MELKSNGDPKLRIRALYLGLDSGPRISFPGTPYTRASKVLYAPMDRPWFRLIHEPPRAYQAGECELTPPYADVSSQLLIVRTIVCKGERISIGRAPKSFALGIDIVIDKSNESINNSLKEISTRVRVTANPFKPLVFNEVEDEGLLGGTTLLKFDKKAIERNGFSLDYMRNFLQHITTSLKKEIMNYGSKTALIVLLLVSVFRLKKETFAYTLLVNTELFGSKEIQSSEFSKNLSIGLNYFVTLAMAVKSSFSIHNEPKVQRAVRAKHRVHIIYGNCFKYSLLGIELLIPSSFKFRDVKLSQNRRDPVSILEVHDFWGSIIRCKSIESEPTLMSKLTRSANEIELGKGALEDIKERYSSVKDIIPSPISSYSSVEKIDKRIALLERKRLRLKVKYEELESLFKKNSVKVINRLSDVTYAIKHQKNNYINLLGRSSENVVRYILCSEQDFKDFQNEHRSLFNEITKAHKNTHSEIHFVLVPETLGANLFNTKREQFILLENFVLVIEGIQNVVTKGISAGEETYLTGYISWSLPDMNYYQLFTQEIEKRIEELNK